MVNLFFSKSCATKAIDCIEVGFDEACQGYASVREGIIAKQRRFGNSLVPPKAKHICNLFENQNLKILEPCVNPGVTKLLILETNSSWTCALANGLHGISSIPHIEMCAENTKTRYVRAVADETKGVESFQFLYKDFSKPESIYRYVYAHNEGAWGFSELGHELPFEVRENYSLRKKRDRLPPWLISQYMSALGIELESSNFFTGKGVLFDYQPFPQTKPLPK